MPIDMEGLGWKNPTVSLSKHDGQNFVPSVWIFMVLNGVKRSEIMDGIKTIDAKKNSVGKLEKESGIMLMEPNLFSFSSSLISFKIKLHQRLRSQILLHCP